MIKLATWNVNSVRARLPRLTEWLAAQTPDIVCLQETKVEDQHFPRESIEDQGYNIVAFGQKTYNGVAVLARHRIENVVTGFPGDGADDPKRALGCQVGDLLVLNLYVPNGEAVGSDKYRGKLEWLARLRSRLDTSYSPTAPLVVCGDFNVTLDDRDVFDPAGMHEKVLCSTAERDALRHVMAFGLSDALRRFHSGGGIYTWWDHFPGSWPKNHGLRIDHFLMTEAALTRCTGVHVDREARAGKAPSDHAPVIATFDH